MSIKELIVTTTHPSWHQILFDACDKLNSSYIDFILNEHYLPTNNRLFAAFGMPLNNLKYILFGQDPYPREQSAIGVAFIDGKVEQIFTAQGLSKEVNKATSLRNFIKMALVARGDLDSSDTSKEAIAKLDKSGLINSIYDLKANFEQNGVLLLNTALVFTDKKSSNFHAKEWQGFMKKLLDSISSDIELILFGNFSKKLKKSLQPKQKAIELEHPYNHTFINNPQAHKLFSSMNLLGFKPNFVE